MLANIKEVDLSSNRLTKIPTCLGAFTSLQKLTLYSNNISELPVDVFGRLQKLNYLDVSSNPSLDSKWKKLLSTGTKHPEIARAVKEWALPEYSKLEKARAKKRKQAEKKKEKDRLAEKARQKEIRTKAWEEKKRRESEEAAHGAGDNGDSDSSEQSSEVQSDEEDTTALINPKPKTSEQRNIVVRLFSGLVWLCFMAIFTVLKYSFYLVASVAMSVLMSYGLCLLTNDTATLSNSTDMQICPVLVTGVDEAWEHVMDGMADFIAAS